VANRSEHLHAEFPDEGTLVRIERALAEVNEVSDPLRRAEALRRKLEPETARWAAEAGRVARACGRAFPVRLDPVRDAARARAVDA
jgi:hypothetical protein